MSINHAKEAQHSRYIINITAFNAAFSLLIGAFLFFPAGLSFNPLINIDIFGYYQILVPSWLFLVMVVDYFWQPLYGSIFAA